MRPDFRACVEAIADTMLREGKPRPGAPDARMLAAFLLATHERMPDYLRLAFRALTLVFDGWPYPTAGKPFHRLEPAARADLFHRWEVSPLPFCRSLVGFYRTFATFGIYSEVYRQDYGMPAHAQPS